MLKIKSITNGKRRDIDMEKQEIKLDPKHRLELLSELEIKTKYSPIYLKSLSDEKLLEMLKDWNNG